MGSCTTASSANNPNHVSRSLAATAARDRIPNSDNISGVRHLGYVGRFLVLGFALCWFAAAYAFGRIGAAFAGIHRANGVELCAEDRIVAFEGSARLQTAVTAAGKRIACDFAVAGIGVEPELPTFTGSPLAVSNGVLVDERCRASAPDIYAAGDVANHLHPVFGRVRVEHYNNAEKQGRAAARSMLGSTAPYDYIHSFWSDQYEHKLEYVGHATAWDQFVVRGSLQERKLVGFYLQGGSLLAAVGLDRGGDPELDRDSEMAACARLVAQRARPAPARLADEHVDLWSLAS